MNNPLTITALVLPMLLTACASTGGNEEKVPLNADPRVGDAVHQVCFTQSISSWKPVDNDRNAILLRMNNKEMYKLKLSGGCDPGWAMTHIAVISRSGSSCYSRGDRIKTDGDMTAGFDTACLIMGINKWDDEAVSPAHKDQAGSRDTGR